MLISSPLPAARPVPMWQRPVTVDRNAGCGTVRCAPVPGVTWDGRGGAGCVAVGTLARPQGTSSWSHLLPGSRFAPAGPLGLRERLGAPRDEFFFMAGNRCSGFVEGSGDLLYPRLLLPLIPL